MIHSKTATDLIKHFEGTRTEAYPDPATGGAPWTIGVGHTGPEVHKGLVWTDGEVTAALDADLQKFDKGVTGLLNGHPTTQNQFDALVSFAFNEGLGNLAKSTLLIKHWAGDYAGAADEFRKWNKANGSVMNGLVARRKAESIVYRS
jgi:lysozyme